MHKLRVFITFAYYWEFAMSKKKKYNLSIRGEKERSKKLRQTAPEPLLTLIEIGS